jgi:hypothetical protein
MTLPITRETTDDVLPAWVRHTLRHMVYGPSDTCWDWSGATHPTSGRPLASTGEHASRAVWRIFYGPIPPGHDVHHRCRHPWCVNPDHLQSLSEDEHAAEHKGIIPDHCKRGHRLDSHNLRTTVRKSDGYLRWWCRQCHADDERERKRKHADQA